MDTNDFEKGKVFINNGSYEVEKLIWNEHPTFKGVYLKHMIKGEDTGSILSCHLVKINPGAEIGVHTHEGKIELHEIIDGSGYCMIENQKLDYQKGIISLIPADKCHSVKADEEGLLLFAKFLPALL